MKALVEDNGLTSYQESLEDIPVYPRRLTGRGGYSFGSFLRDAESIGNRAVKKGIPAIKNLLGRGMYTGRGMYQNETNTNELMAGSSSMSAQCAGDETGGFTISNREYVGDIFGPTVTGAFQNTPFPLNPGLEQTFPWLSQLACNYEEYEFIQLVFEFRSTVQDVNSNNGQVGTVIACTNYNSSSKVFTDKPTMQAYYGAISGRTTDNFIHGIECDPNKLSGTVGSYVRNNPVMSGEDLKLYDHGIFQLATHNVPEALLNATLGELWVNYTVKLRKPKFYSGRGLAITRATWCSKGGESKTDIMGNKADNNSRNMLSGQQNNLSIYLSSETPNALIFTIPAYYAGNLRFVVAVEGATFTAGDFLSTVTLTGNIVKANDLQAGGFTALNDNPYFSLQLNNTTNALAMFDVKVAPATDGTNNTVTFTYSLGANAAPSQSWVDITEYNSGFNNTLDNIVFINKSGVITEP